MISMPEAPVFNGTNDPVEILRIVSENPILCYCEPPQTYKETERRGWMSYYEGRWNITELGKQILKESFLKTSDKKEPQSVSDFFGF